MNNNESNNNDEESATERNPLPLIKKEHCSLDFSNIQCECCDTRDNEPVVSLDGNSVHYNNPEGEPLVRNSTVLNERNENTRKSKTLSLRKYYQPKIENLTDKLIEAIRKNDIHRIEEIVQISSKDQINSRDKDNKLPIVIACVERNVEATTLSTLLSTIKDRFRVIDCIDDLWYGWEPIHYAARVADPEKMKIVAEFTNVDSLTYYSENALHILMENMKYSIHGHFINDLISIPCCLISEMSPNILRCANILMQHHIDATQSNFWNETPISLALKYRYYKFVKQMLKEHPYIDIENGIKYEENLREFQELMNIRPSCCDVYQEPAVILFNFLKNDDVESFLRFMNGNIVEYVKDVDGGYDFTTSGTMLQLCFRKLILEYLQCEKYGVLLMDDECDILDTPIFDVFRSSGMRRCIDHLLNNGANPNKLTRKFGETLLEAAAVRGHYPLVAVLLQHKRSKIIADDIFKILPKMFNTKMNLINQEIYRKFVLTLLLNKLLTLQNDKPFSDEKREILNETLVNLNLGDVFNKTNDEVNIYQLLRLGASLTYKDQHGKTVIELLDYEILETHFDDCIDNNMFHYDSIVEDFGKSYSETETLTFVASDKKKNRLLTSPVITVLIHEKWFKVNWLFYVNLIFYILFVFCIYGYVISGFSGEEVYWINGFFYTSLCFHGVKELIQLVLYQMKYLKDFTNVIEIIVLCLCFWCIISPNVYVKTIAVLSATVILFLFLVEVPKFTKFTFILGSLKYFFQYACFYFIPFMSFAICLNILFPHIYESKNKTESVKSIEQNITESKNDTYDPSKNYLEELSIHLFETLILFTGEFNERVLQPQVYTVFGRIFMTVFILCMTIVLNNLLVGLIVSDMDRIEKECRIYKRIKMANFIIRIADCLKKLETFTTLCCFAKCLNLEMFQKGSVKSVEINETIKEHFDEKNKQHLEELENMKWTLYDENVLKKVHDDIYKDDKD